MSKIVKLKSHATFTTYEVNGKVWGAVKKYAVNSNAVALRNKQALKKRNADIVLRIKQGDKRRHFAIEDGISPGMVSTIKCRAGLPPVAYRNPT